MHFLLKTLVLSTAVLMAAENVAAADMSGVVGDSQPSGSVHDTVMGFFDQMDKDVKTVTKSLLTKDMGVDIGLLGLTADSSYMDALKVLRDQIKQRVVQRDALTLTTSPAIDDVVRIHDMLEESERTLRTLNEEQATLKMLAAEKPRVQPVPGVTSFHDTIMGFFQTHETHIIALIRKILGRDMGVLVDSLGTTYVDALRILRDNIRALVEDNQRNALAQKDLVEGAKEFAETVQKLNANTWQSAMLRGEPARFYRTDSLVVQKPNPVAVEYDLEAHSARYIEMYNSLKETWKQVIDADNPLALFFENGVIENSELTSTAVLSLMYQYMIEHSEIYIPDLKNFGLFTIAECDSATQTVVISQLQQLKDKLLNQALRTFEKGQKLFAAIVQVGGSKGGHYTLVVIERDGTVHMINTMGAFGGDAKNDVYTFIMPKLVEALNAHKGEAQIVFTAGRNVRTGIQDADALSNSCGIYSFVYWAALMKTQDINAYKRVTAAVVDGYLGDWMDIEKAAVYEDQLDVMPRTLDRTDESGIAYYKNKNAALQANFEREMRDKLQINGASL